MRRLSVAIALVACACAPVMDETPPSVEAIGTGKVLTVERITAPSGESSGTRALYGALAGGLVGATLAAGATEDNLGQSRLNRYGIDLGDGRRATYNSFSIVSVDDCVKIARIRGRDDVVLERSDVARCR